MKPRKGELLVVLPLLICAAFMFLGCPPRDGEPGGGIDPNPGGGEPQLYQIRHSAVHTAGTVNVTPSSLWAARDQEVTIELVPLPGYEPYGLNVFNFANNRPLALSPDVISNVYKYTFRMDASVVIIKVDFISLNDAINNYNTSIKAADDWKYIKALNDLIQKADPNSPRVIDAETNLSGITREVLAENNDELKNDATGMNGLYKRYEAPASRGIIRTKIRSENFLEWFPTVQNWPSDSIEKGADLFLYKEAPATPAPNPNTPIEIAPNANPSNNDSFSDTLGTDLTILYYVRQDYPTFPNPSPKPGWRHGERADVVTVENNALFAPFLGPNLEAVQEIPLRFSVGLSPDHAVTYRLWLWPVAQYTLENNLGANANTTVTLQDYEYNDPNPPPPDPPNPYPWVERGESKTLIGHNAKATSYVGRDVNPRPDNPPTRPDNLTSATAISKSSTREVMVEISTTRQGVLIEVLTSSRFPVRDVFGDDLVYIQAGKPGYFCPDSAQYIIVVKPTSPPGNM